MQTISQHYAGSKQLFFYIPCPVSSTYSMTPWFPKGVRHCSMTEDDSKFSCYTGSNSMPASHPTTNTDSPNQGTQSSIMLIIQSPHSPAFWFGLGSSCHQREESQHLGRKTLASTVHIDHFFLHFCSSPGVKSDYEFSSSISTTSMIKFDWIVSLCLLFSSLFE